jgi:hypothetical protein
MKRTRFQAFVEYLLDNLFDIATILVAGYLVIRHQVQPFASTDIAELATWILAVLGLIAVSGLWDRNRRLHRIEKLSEESHNLLERHTREEVRAGDFFLSERRLSNQTFAQATTIYLSGVTLSRTIREFMHVLSQRLVAGAHIRIIIADPNKDSLLQDFTLRTMGDTNIDFWRARLQTVETWISAIAQTPDSTGKLEVGYLPYMPSFGFIMLDPDEAHGHCFVELYHHKSAEPNPAFALRATDDPHWYRFFRQQYQALWNSCRVETLPEITTQAKPN